MGIGDVSTENSNVEPLPSLPAFSTEQSEYVLIEGDPDNQVALAGVEALIAHFDANEATLRVEHQRRGALASAQARYSSKHPDKPDDFIMQFWVPESANGKTINE